MRAKLAKNLGFLALLQSLVIISSSAHSATCQELYAANRTALLGVIVQRFYPGPPNYDVGSNRESIKALRLAKKICLTRNASEDFPEDANLVQLYFNAEAGSLARRALPGCYARVEGELFEAESGRHHTPFVLAVTSVTVLKGCSGKTIYPTATPVPTTPQTQLAEPS